jgi:glycosyltransferase involved in cell wall biosynthesis
MPKPRIAILHYASPPTIGGVESTIAAHARLFADHGYGVKVLTGRGGVFDARVPVEVLPEVDSKAAEVLEANAQLNQGLVSARFEALTHRLRRELTRALADCDVVIAHNVLSLHKNLALTAALHGMAMAGRISVIAWCHDFAWSDPQYAEEMHPGEPWEWLREPWPGTRYVVVSRARERELRLLWGDKGLATAITVVPPGIDPIGFLGISSQANQWVRELDLLDAAPLLLLPARLTRRKNIEFAIEITAALRDQMPHAKLVVTGPPGPHNPTNAAYLEQLRSLRRDLGADRAVVLLHEYGEVYGAVLRDLYLLADALLFPSKREGFGIPVLEAGLARLPIFCSDLEPFRESAGENAHYLSPAEPPRSAANRIASCLGQDSAYRLKQRVIQEYTWDKVFVKRIEPLLAEGGAHAG